MVSLRPAWATENDYVSKTIPCETNMAKLSTVLQVVGRREESLGKNYYIMSLPPI